MRPKSLILLALALGCGLVASLGINQVMSKGSPVAQASTEKLTVFVAKKDIAMNDLITEEMLVTKQFPKDAVHKDVITKLDDIKDRRARQRIIVDRPILSSELLPKGQTARGSEHIPPGMRTVGVKVDAVATSGYLIKPGDHVDLMVYLKKSGQATGIEQTMIKTFMQNVKVFAVDNVLTENPDGKGTKTIKTITLLVTPEQAEIVTMASNLGKITMAMRSPTDAKLAEFNSPRLARHILAADQGDEPETQDDPLPVAAAQPDKPAGKSWLDVIRSLKSQDQIKPAKSAFVMTVFEGSAVKQFQIVDNSPIPIPMERAGGTTSQDLTKPATSLPATTEDEDEDEDQT
jgi:pilus assembly protein CpaB